MTDIAARFRRDTADHRMTVLHDDGLYRHVRFRAPGTEIAGFDLVTWPGKLSIGGDMEGYVFSRLDDMFAFFRGTTDINPGYWAEKVVAGREGVQRYSEDATKAQITEHVADYERDYPQMVADYERGKAAGRAPVEPATLEEIRGILADAESDGMFDHEGGARDVLNQLEGVGVVSGTWEWDLTDWHWAYLWACHAIVWGISQYDAARAPQAVEA